MKSKALSAKEPTALSTRPKSRKLEKLVSTASCILFNLHQIKFPLYLSSFIEFLIAYLTVTAQRLSLVIGLRSSSVVFQTVTAKMSRNRKLSEIDWLTNKLNVCSGH